MEAAASRLLYYFLGNLFFLYHGSQNRPFDRVLDYPYPNLGWIGPGIDPGLGWASLGILVLVHIVLKSFLCTTMPYCNL